MLNICEGLSFCLRRFHNGVRTAALGGSAAPGKGLKRSVDDARLIGALFSASDFRKRRMPTATFSVLSAASATPRDESTIEEDDDDAAAAACHRAIVESVAWEAAESGRRRLWASLFLSHSLCGEAIGIRFGRSSTGICLVLLARRMLPSIGFLLFSTEALS